VNEEEEYRAARSFLDVSASEVKREMGTDILRRLDPDGTSDTKLIELAMSAVWRIKSRGRSNPEET
jgi:hypothetical protein